MKGILLFIGLFFIGSAWTQDVNSILKKVNDTYTGKNVSYSTEYELFKGHKSNTVHSSYTGEVISYDGNVYQKIDKTEFVYTSNFSVKISEKEKDLVVLAGKTNVKPELDLELALKECSSNKLEDKGSFYRIVLIMKASSSLQCSVVKLELDKANFTLKQIDIYYSFLQDFSSVYSQQDLKQPHMRIKFSDTNLSAQSESDLFSESTYYSAKDTSLKPLGKYASYTIHDNR